MDNTKESCTCTICQGFCKYKPGWFKPDQMEALAEFFDATIQEVYKTYLVTDYWVDDNGRDINVISPTVTRLPAGGMMDFRATGQCVFYTDGKCEIHPVKPWECKQAWHGDGTDKLPYHKLVMEAWKDKQDLIIEITGEEQSLPDANIFDVLDLIFGDI